MNPRPRTFLFAPASNVLFHVGRSVVVARELARRGHRIVLAGSARYLRDRTVVGPGEFEYHPLPDFGADEGMEILRRLTRVPSRELVERMVEAETEAIRRIAPDVVVADFRPTICVAARASGVPLVSLLLSHWMQRLSSAPPRVLRTYALSDAVRAILGDRLTARVTPALVRAVIRRKMGPLGAAARARGQRGQRLIWDLLEGDLNLLTDTEGWSPTRRLPASFHRVGPIVWEPDLPVPDSLADLDPELPTVYVTFGSTGHPELFRLIFAEFAGTPYQVILSTGGQIDPGDFDVPRNFVVERFLPNAEIMDRADLVIYHGGAGTAYQAIRAGLPGIVIATHWDQEYAGFATEDHGLGLYLPMRQVVRSPGLLLRGTRRVLDQLPAHRGRAEVLQRELSKYDGPVSAADRIEAFLEERQG